MQGKIVLKHTRHVLTAPILLRPVPAAWAGWTISLHVGSTYSFIGLSLVGLSNRRSSLLFRPFLFPASLPFLHLDFACLLGSPLFFCSRSRSCFLPFLFVVRILLPIKLVAGQAFVPADMVLEAKSEAALEACDYRLIGASVVDLPPTASGPWAPDKAGVPLYQA